MTYFGRLDICKKLREKQRKMQRYRARRFFFSIELTQYFFYACILVTQETAIFRAEKKYRSGLRSCSNKSGMLKWNSPLRGSITRDFTTLEHTEAGLNRDKMDDNIETPFRTLQRIRTFEIGLVRFVENFSKRQESCPRRNNNARFPLPSSFRLVRENVGSVSRLERGAGR